MIEKLLTGLLIAVGVVLIIYSLYDSTVNNTLLSRTDIIAGGISLGVGMQILSMRKKRIGKGNG